MADKPRVDAVSAAMKAIFDQVGPDEPGARRTWDSGQSAIALTSWQLWQLMLDGLAAAAPHLAPRPDGERVEAVTYRDSDLDGEAGNQLAVFINGVPVTVEHTIIDPGAGDCDADTWNQRCEAAAASASPLAARQIHDWFAVGADTEYVTAPRDPQDPLVRVVWESRATIQHEALIPRSVLAAAAENTDDGDYMLEDGSIYQDAFSGVVTGDFHAVLARFEPESPNDVDNRDWVHVEETDTPGGAS